MSAAQQRYLSVCYFITLPYSNRLSILESLPACQSDLTRVGGDQLQALDVLHMTRSVDCRLKSSQMKYYQLNMHSNSSLTISWSFQTTPKNTNTLELVIVQSAAEVEQIWRRFKYHETQENLSPLFASKVNLDSFLDFTATNPEHTCYFFVFFNHVVASSNSNDPESLFNVAELFSSQKDPSDDFHGNIHFDALLNTYPTSSFTQCSVSDYRCPLSFEKQNYILVSAPTSDLHPSYWARLMERPR